MENCAQLAGRNIILLSDGTGNSAGKLFKTNVWRIYEALDLSNASQIAFYDDGVGNSAIKPLAVLGGAFGWGLKRNVLSLYTFLCRNYQPGDRIYGFGFSRGAFTMRVLIKFVLSQGLVADATSNDDLRRKALRFYRNFRVEQTRHYGLHTLARPVRDGLVLLWDWILGHRELRNVKTIELPAITFLGLWDTVDAYGLPVEELKYGVDRWIWPLALNDRTLHPKIQKACHALAIDDSRKTFHPLLWDETDAPLAQHTDDEVLTQIWFAGMHANVGGGYPDDALSYLPLRWIVDEAQKKSLKFNPLALEAIDVKVSPQGRMYDSRAGLGAYYRFDPRRLNPPRDHQNACIPQPKIHETVFWRIAIGTDAYAPLSLPNELRVLTRDRSAPESVRTPNILDFEAYRAAVQAEGDLFGAPAGSGAVPAVRHAAAATFGALKIPDDKTLGLLWDTVWWRRIAYFATLASTALLVLFPALFDAKPTETVGVDLYGNSSVSIPSAYTRAVVAVATAVLPGLAKPWIDVFQFHPVAMTVTLAAVVISYAWGRIIDRRIHDRALAAWNPKWESARWRWLQQSIRTRYVMAAILVVLALGIGWQVLIILFAIIAEPDIASLLAISLPALPVLALAVGSAAWAFALFRIARRARAAQVEIPGAALALARRLRTSPRATALYRYLGRHVIPTVFAFALLALIVAGLSRMSFELMDAGGSVCRYAEAEEIPAAGKSIAFDISSVCTATGIRLKANTKYMMEIAEPVDWYDGQPSGGRKVGPEGNSSLSIAPPKLLLLPLRRWLTKPWFVPIARIGDTGDEEYTLTRHPTEIVPKRSAELFLYVNEAVIGLPWWYDRFYRDNVGTAQITITPPREVMK